MKASASYPSVVRGVSQQVPSQRGPGRLTEQVNMIPDPVEGLCRRHGSYWEAETSLGAEYTGDTLAAMIADTANWRTFEYSNAGVDYTILYRTSATVSGTPLAPLLVYDRTNKQFLTYTTRAALDDPLPPLLESGGISAITAVGKYVFMAGNSVVPSATSVDVWGTSPNKDNSVVWVRGGAYSRTFKVKAVSGGVEFEFEYTTPTSSYPGTLDTSGVPVYAADPAGGTSIDTEAAYLTAANGANHALAWATWTPSALTANKGGTPLTNVYPALPANATEFTWGPTGDGDVQFHSSLIGAQDVTVTYTHVKTISNPNYAKTVADITNAYNTAVTQWIGTAAAAIQPEAIAESLRQAAVDSGLTTGTLRGSHLVFTNVQNVVVDDSGDGTLLRGVANEVSSVDQVSAIHMIGKVVKVRAKDSEEAFYLKATAKSPLDGTGSFSEVIWVEGAGTETTIDQALLYGTIGAGNTFCVAGSAFDLEVMVGGDVPDYAASTAGDLDTEPVPYFIGKKITYLGVFQDRLMVGADAVIRTSRIGDYLNFFRGTVTSVLADDPVEMLSQGSDDDILRHSVLYDKDIVIFGDKRQYLISGRVPLTPTSANMPTLSSHKHAASIPPLAVGGVIFYGKLGEIASSIYQIQPGRNTESPEAYPVSSQLNTYIAGRAIEMVNNAEPTVLFVRADDARNSLYLFHFLDSEEGRKQDAWHRWEFNEALGTIVGMNPTPEGLMLFTIRQAHGQSWLVVDICPMTAGLSTDPYLDSRRPWEQVDAGTGSLRVDTPGDWFSAFNSDTVYRFLGGDLSESEELLASYPLASGLVSGAGFQAYMEPTNPYLRDSNDQAITTGQLVVAKVVVSMSKSSGFDSVVTAANEVIEDSFNGRVLGDPNNIIGRTVVTDADWSVAIGRETRAYTLKLYAREWLPFTVTLLQWVGQSFNRTQRF